MNNQHHLCRLPFRSGDGTARYYVMGEMTDDPDVDFQVAIESLTDMCKLPFCADCFETYLLDSDYEVVIVDNLINSKASMVDRVN
jgi:hypothetical protein